MDHRKLDAALALALHDVPDLDERAFVVFIGTKPGLGPAETAVLERYGVAVRSRTGPLFTATLSRQVVEELSELPWVRSLELSATRRPLHPR